MRATALLSVLALAPAGAWAQRIPVASAPVDPAVRDDVLAKLRSTRVSDLAWGGYLAGAHQVHEAAPQLRAALARVRDGEVTEQWLCAHALLDGLIRLGPPVPAAEIEPFLEGAAMESALVLLAQRPRENADALLAFFRRIDANGLNHEPWTATGNLLTQARARGFAAAALDGLELTLEVRIRRSEDEGWGGSGSHSVAIACGGPDVPSDFPPIAVYSLAAAPPRGRWSLLAPGRTPVGYTRREVRGRFGWPCDGSSHEEGHVERVGWLAELASVQPLEWRTRIDLVWRTDEQLLADVDRARSALQARFDALIAALIARGHLPETARATAAPIKMVVQHTLGPDARLPLPTAWLSDQRR